MTGFWFNHVQSVGGPLTREALDAAVKAMREQQDAYHREPPMQIVYPPYLAKEMRK